MEPTTTNFLRAKIDADRAAGKHDGMVRTRFPPEPNGFLHIGHAKAICVNFGLAEAYGGTCNLRFDDTNPITEDAVYAENILADVRWLGFEPAEVRYASDYFDQLYAWAEQLVGKGLAYVDDQDLEQIRANRGTVTEPGTPSPWRDRTPAENLDLLRRMRAGAFADGAKVLRARIDMAHPNMQMRDPLMYRIRHAHHYRTGDAWCIYPMYDWAHGQSDAIEGITHSLCSLEFEVHRELYDWFTEALELDSPPEQTEFARLNLTYTVMSKRFFKRIVDEGVVEGWDDPRMPTLCGLRRRGVRPEALRAFAERVGVARANSVVDLGLFEWTVRDDLNHVAPRRMAVRDPLPVELTNWPDGEVVTLTAPDFPPDVGRPGERQVPFGRHVLIERSDFAVDPPEGFRRLVPGGEVRLRYGYVIRCDQVLTDADGVVTGLKCSVDPDTLGAAPAGRKVRGVIHWVSAAHAVPAELRWVDRLFRAASPGEATGDYMDDLHADSLTVEHVHVEPAAAAGSPGDRFQFERHGYVHRAPEDADRGLVFTLTVGLKDSWSAEPEPEPEPEPEVIDPTANAEAQARIKAEARAAFFEDHPDAEDAFQTLVTAGAPDDVAWTVASEPVLRVLHAQAAQVAEAASAASWIANALVAEAKDRLDDLPFDGTAFGELVRLVDDGTLNTKLGRKVLLEMLAGAGAPRAIAEDRGWVQVSDTAALEAMVDEVLAAHPDEVARYRAGETKLAGFLMGQVMRASRGKANPAVAKDILDAKLAG